MLPRCRGDDAFGKPGMALIGVRGALPGGFFTGMGVAEGALLGSVGVGPYDLAEGRNMLRVSGQLMEGVVENGDADSGNVVKVPQKGI